MHAARLHGRSETSNSRSKLGEQALRLHQTKSRTFFCLALANVAAILLWRASYIAPAPAAPAACVDSKGEENTYTAHLACPPQATKMLSFACGFGNRGASNSAEQR